MSKQRYPEEFKTEAVRQITERGHAVADGWIQPLVVTPSTLGVLWEDLRTGCRSRRGKCHDNAVAESYFQLLKRERIRSQVYLTRDKARADVFNYIEKFYNPKRRHGTAGDVSPIEFERRHFQRLKSVWGIRGDSACQTEGPLHGAYREFARGGDRLHSLHKRHSPIH